ncbi:MAG: CDP-alcohol phosphatidyltransferase family protein [Granulosicoccus sp.]
MSKSSDPVTEDPAAQTANRTAVFSSHDPDRSHGIITPRGTARSLFAASALLLVSHILLDRLLPSFGLTAALASLVIWSIIAFVIWHFRYYHPFNHFGHANTVTTLRALSTAILAGFIPIATEISSDTWLWAIAATATFTLCLDGLDGYLARRGNMCSAFGARFDMEIDALLALVITLFLWQSGQTGVWVLALGLMRYAFLGAGIYLVFIRGELYPSTRRKVVCVIQVAALCLMLCPWFSTLQATVIGALALACLSYSFVVDVIWLFRLHHTSLAHQQKQTGQAGK